MVVKLVEGIPLDPVVGSAVHRDWRHAHVERSRTSVERRLHHEPRVHACSDGLVKSVVWLVKQGVHHCGVRREAARVHDDRFRLDDVLLAGNDVAGLDSRHFVAFDYDFVALGLEHELRALGDRLVDELALVFPNKLATVFVAAGVRPARAY